MSSLLEMLGKGLEKPFMELVLPGAQPLTVAQAKLLSEQVGRSGEHTANKLRLGIHYAQSGATEKAKQLFQEILAQEPAHPDARLAWAAMHMSEGELDAAIEQLKNGYCQNRGDSRVMYGLGNCYERQGQKEEAYRYYREATAGHPYLRQARQRIAAMFLQDQHYVLAIEQCQILQNEHPEEVQVYLFLGQLYLLTEQYSQAAATFERAITIEPDNFELHDDYVESLVKSDQLPEAIEQMHRIISQQGEFADNYLRLADLYVQVGEDDSAIRNYERSLELHPGYLEAAVKLGTQHLRRGRFYPAASNFNRAIEINDQIISAYVGLALAYQYDQQGEAAQDMLELASALEPNTNLLFAEVVRLQLKVAMEQKVRQEFLGCAQQDQVSAQEMNDLLDLQIERHRQSLKANPNQADLHYRYGLLLRGRGQTAEAIEHFRTAVKINPSYLKARIKLGLALRDAERVKEALAELTEALKVKPEYVNLHYQLGLMYCDKIKFALAVEHFETMQKDPADNMNVQANLALALQNMGLIDRARASWQAVCELEPQSPLAFKAQREAVCLHTIW